MDVLHREKLGRLAARRQAAKRGHGQPENIWCFTFTADSIDEAAVLAVGHCGRRIEDAIAGRKPGTAEVWVTIANDVVMDAATLGATPSVTSLLDAKINEWIYRLRYAREAG